MGLSLINYYHDVIFRNLERNNQLKDRVKKIEQAISQNEAVLSKEKIKEFNFETTLLNNLPSEYQGIKMVRLPKGIDPQAHVQIIVQHPDHTT